MQLVDYRKAENTFFVRTTDEKDKVKEVFGEVSYVELPDLTGEYGFVTAPMREETFAEKEKQLAEVLSVIRVGK